MTAASSICLAYIFLASCCLLNAFLKIHLCARGQLEVFVPLIPVNPVLRIYIRLKQWGAFVPTLCINLDLTQWPWSCKDLFVLFNSSTWIILGTALKLNCFEVFFCWMRLLQIKPFSLMCLAQFWMILGSDKRNETMFFSFLTVLSWVYSLDFLDIVGRCVNHNCFWLFLLLLFWLFMKSKSLKI